MSKYTFTILALTIVSGQIKSQDLNVYLEKNAIKIDSLSKNVYDLLANYQIIMIGEIHGTNEPVNLVNDLVALFTKYGDSVQVGFEIPDRQMKSFLIHKTTSSILKSEFFQLPSGDGRASIAWYKTIAILNANKKVEIFFFDKNFDKSDYSDADSVMYLKIKSQIKTHPNWRTITISGNIHNSLINYKGRNTIGTLILKDRDLNLANSFCSLNHEFESGETLWNEFKPMQSIYTKVSYDKYLCLFPQNTNEPYHGIYFTKYLTKSKSAVLK